MASYVKKLVDINGNQVYPRTKISAVDDLQSTIDTLVPSSRTVNGKSLTSDVTIASTDISHGSTTVGAELTSQSTLISNKQNKIWQSETEPTEAVIGDYWDDPNDTLVSVAVDSVPTSGSTNAVSSGGVYTTNSNLSSQITTLDSKLTSKSATSSDVGKFAKIKTVDSTTNKITEWEYGDANGYTVTIL